jgi:hypothetical protein
MFGELRDSLGIPGLIAVVVLALVLLGVGYAARGEGSESGESWPSDSKLPAGATLTGGWSFSTKEPGEILVPLSFPLQLPVEALLVEKVHFQPPNEPGKAKTEFEEACGAVDNAAVEPKPDPGHLCVYYNPFGDWPVNATFNRISPLTRWKEEIASEEWATDSAGALLHFDFSGAPGERAAGAGTFAVTAPVAGS